MERTELIKALKEAFGNRIHESKPIVKKERTSIYLLSDSTMFDDGAIYSHVVAHFDCDGNVDIVRTDTTFESLETPKIETHAINMSMEELESLILAYLDEE